MESISSLYYYHVDREAKDTEERAKKFGDCITTLIKITLSLKEIKAASSIMEEAESWKDKLEKKYDISQKLDPKDKSFGRCCI